MNESTPPVQYEPVNTAQMLLQRTEIKGAEVEAYVQTYNWLESIKTGEFTVLQTKILTALRLKSEEQAESVKHLQEKVDRMRYQQAEETIDGAKGEEGIPVLEEDTSGGEAMVSEGGPAA